MKKKELVKVLEEASKAEEEVTVTYLNHIQEILTMKADKNFLKKITDDVNFLIKETKGHKVNCVRILDEIKDKGDEDDI